MSSRSGSGRTGHPGAASPRARMAAMVRRDDSKPPEGRPTERAESRCACPAGESPARVIAGEPGSRPAPETERPTGEAWCRKPFAAQAVGGERQRGPQHQVKPAASSDLQSERRAEHVAAKATSPRRESGWRGGLGGVWGAARAEGQVWNTRDPSAQPTSGEDRPYKPSAKSGGAQRESEGAVVPTMAAKNNAAGGKGPCSGHAEGRGRHEGMTEPARSNHPHEQLLAAKVPLGGPLGKTAEWRVRRYLDVQETLRGNDALRRASETPMIVAAQAASRRPPESRVREIRTHGLKGGGGNRTA